MTSDKVTQLLREVTATLGAARIERPRWTAEQIAAAVLGCEPVALVTAPPPLDSETSVAIQRRVAQRAAGMPLQYLTGIAGFCGLDLWVRPGVFIPRPETERVVEVAIRELSRLPTPSTVVDVGSGSGAIAIGLTSVVKHVRIQGFEISRPALAVAQANARRLGARVQWVCADLLAPCGEGRIDLVVANLPYIPSETLASLPREVQWDPPEALDGGPDGLQLIRRLLDQVVRGLRPHGVVVLEVGQGQARTLVEDEEGRWGASEIVRDDTGVERVVVFRRPMSRRTKV